MTSWVAFAQNYFVSSSAPVSGTGTLGSPWNSFTEVNVLLGSASTIDTIFLKCGDIFRDQMTVGVASDFVISAYDTGNQPIISGADSVLGWTTISGYWQADFFEPVTHFFANHQEQIPARYPDEGMYLLVDAATINDLTDSDLSAFSSSVLDSAQVCVHTEQWCWEKSPIESSAGTVITYTNPTLKFPTVGYGYFLYDEITFLTVGKEWIYDNIAQKIYYMPVSGDPNDLLCEASVRNYGILFGAGVTNVKIEEISFEKQAIAGVGIINADNEEIIIDNCSFARQYHYGVDQQGTEVEISNCSFREVDGFAVFLNGTCTKTEVHHNTFRNNGGFRNSGVGLEINLSSIKGSYVDSCHIHHNDIDSAGYCGISMDGMWNIIERNVVKNAMLLNNDGAALKSFGPASQFNIFRNNFVSLSDGNTEGAPFGPPDSYFPTPAIYFDFNTNNCTIHENTIYDHAKKGIFLNSGSNTNTVTNNVVYGGSYLLDFNGSPIMPTPMTGMTVKKNVLFAKDPDTYLVRVVDNTSGFNHGYIDSNYYFQPYNSDNYAFEPPSTSYTFGNWTSTTGYDLNSISSFVSWTLPTALDTLIMNPSDNIVTVDLGSSKYLDLDSNEVCGDITLQPYTSVILIDTETECPGAGLNDVLKVEIRLFPNPANEQLTVTSDKPFESVQIYDLSGRIQQRRTVLANSIEMNVSELENGMYVVELNYTNGTRISERITVIH